MAKISFNPQSLGCVTNPPNTDVGGTVPPCAFEPIVVLKPSIKAIVERLRLANIESFVTPQAGGTAKYVDA